jgi:23S rRNA pseudouridine1911/1915/1917 synthase
MKFLTAPENRGLRLDVFLTQRLQKLTRSQIQMLNRSGAVRVDGRQDKGGYRLRGGETIEVNLDALEPTPITPEHIPLQIYFEDEDLAVIEKPAGVVVHPGSGAKRGTVVHGLLFHFQSLSTAGGASRPGIVHRLDKNTSGLLIVAKNNVAHARLSKAFHDREIQKTYCALVHGRMRRDSETIELPVGRHPTVRTKMAAGKAGGRAAYTEYRVKERFREFSLLDVGIKTGRTHQIRVHLAAIGHPVVGDNIYGEASYKEFTRRFGPMNRYFLHAMGLRLTHPVTGVALEFHSPLPPELQKLLKSIKS